MEPIKHSVARPERVGQRAISLSALVKGLAVLVVIILGVSLSLAYVHDRRYTPFEQAMWDLFISLRHGIAGAGTFLEGFLPSTGNQSAAEVNHVSWLAANKCLDEAGGICEALQGLDREHRAE